MKCTRCGNEVPEIPIHITLNQGGKQATWTFCNPCEIGLSAWYHVRQKEFPPPGEPVDRVNAELLHACRQALDACGGYPQLLDLLRTAIRGAVIGEATRKPPESP